MVVVNNASKWCQLWLMIIKELFLKSPFDHLYHDFVFICEDSTSMVFHGLLPFAVDLDKKKYD